MRASDKMPTIGRLIASLALAGLCWFVTGMIMEAWPFEKDFGHFQKVSAAVGIVLGWRTIGSRLGRGAAASVSTGLTAFGACTFWVFFLRAFSDMIDRSLDLRYDGVSEALQGLFGIMYEFAVVSSELNILLTAILGSIGVAMLAELFTRRSA